MCVGVVGSVGQLQEGSVNLKKAARKPHGHFSKWIKLNGCGLSRDISRLLLTSIVME